VGSSRTRDLRPYSILNRRGAGQSRSNAAIWHFAIHSFNLKSKQKFDPKKHVERLLGRVAEARRVEPPETPAPEPAAVAAAVPAAPLDGHPPANEWRH
jgi:hypothetical protein